MAFGIIVWFGTDTFLSWAGYLAMTLIPFSIIIGLVWQSNYPPPAAEMQQPLKGLYLLLINMIVGSVVAAWSLKTVGGFVTPPTPFLAFFTIMTVIITFWCVVVWQCWPAAGIKGDHPAFVGFGTLIVSYAVAWNYSSRSSISASPRARPSIRLPSTRPGPLTPGWSLPSSSPA